MLSRSIAFHLCAYYLPLLLCTTTTVSATGNWKLILYYGPAPSPEDGPPLSAHASRNKALLPAQIGGIVGAYVLVVVFLLTTLLTIGKRLRTATEQSISSLSVEMVKPNARNYDPSPISPGSQKRYPWSPIKEKFSRSHSDVGSNLSSPQVGSIASFDNRVLDVDKQQRQLEMERLYAAVMEHEDQKESTLSPSAVTHDDLPPSPPLDFDDDVRQRASPKRKGELRIVTELANARSGNGPSSARSGSVRAIYPPGAALPMGPQSPTSPIRAGEPPTPISPVHQRYNGGQAPASPRKSLVPSIGSNSSRTRKAIKNLRISAPIKLDTDEESTPLTPRFYDPPPPPSPPSQPTTPGTARTVGSQSSYGRERLDEPQPLPSPAPQRGLQPGRTFSPGTASEASTAVNSAITPSTTSTLAAPPFPEARPRMTVNTSLAPGLSFPTASSQGTLPFRAQRQQTDPNFGGLRSPSIKENFVITRPDPLRGPKTGVPTPYSPYMPFTPLTPVTPGRLVTRMERKQRKKDVGRRVATREDLVEAPEETWGDGY